MEAKYDFFISYNKADTHWAEWIAWQLEEAGYRTLIQVWDFRPGSNFVLDMDKATEEANRTIIVLSPDYLKSIYTQPEWAAAFAKDPTGEKGLLIPVRVSQCELKRMLAQIVYIDLVGLAEEAARDALLKGIKIGRVKPVSAPGFPGFEMHPAGKQPRFPGTLPPIWRVPYNRNPNFTGRDKELTCLHEQLASGAHAALTQAISGLGGVGKTQLALEYTYRHAGEYDLVWWVRSEEPATLATDIAELAGPLGLPQAAIAEQELKVQAVRQKLGQMTDWLMVFDNAGKPEDILPKNLTDPVKEYHYNIDDFLPLLTYDNGNQAALENKLYEIHRLLETKPVKPNSDDCFTIPAKFISTEAYDDLGAALILWLRSSVLVSKCISQAKLYSGTHQKEKGMSGFSLPFFFLNMVWLLQGLRE